MNTFAYLLRREVWEHRAFLVAPPVVAIILVLALISLIVHHEIVALLGRIPAEAHDVAMSQFPIFLALPFNVVMVFVVAFYLMDSLYAERRDRSILFWKSLPLSDTVTVASKLVVALLIAPLLTLAAVLGTQILFLVIATPVVWFAGESAWALLWKPTSLIESTTFLGYGLAVQSLWYFPIFAWLLLVSAWAKRAVFLWAFLTPLAVIFLEDVVFYSHHFAHLLEERLIGVFPLAFHLEGSAEKIEFYVDGEKIQATAQLADLLNPTAFLTSPGLWAGIVVGIAFVAAAIWLRRYRDDS